MLHEFLTIHRLELIERCRAKVAQRVAPEATARELEYGIEIFLNQLIKTLRVEQGAEPHESRRVSGPSGGQPVLSEVSQSAALHGRELLAHGFTIDQVVHDYGDLCQSITDLAFELKEPFEIDEFRTSTAAWTTASPKPSRNSASSATSSWTKNWAPPPRSALASLPTSCATG